MCSLPRRGCSIRATCSGAVMEMMASRARYTVEITHEKGKTSATLLCDQVAAAPSPNRRILTTAIGSDGRQTYHRSTSHAAWVSEPHAACHVGWRRASPCASRQGRRHIADAVLV